MGELALDGGLYRNVVLDHGEIDCGVRAALELEKGLRAVFPEKEILRVAGLAGIRVDKLGLPVLVNLDIFDEALSSSLVLELEASYDPGGDVRDVKHLNDEPAPVAVLLEKRGLLIRCVQDLHQLLGEGDGIGGLLPCVLDDVVQDLEIGVRLDDGGVSSRYRDL